MPGRSPTIVGDAPSLIPVGQFSDQPPILLDRPCLLIGAKDGCDLQLTFSNLSDVHAVIIAAAEGIFIRSLAGTSGVLINGQPAREQLLCDGDDVRMAEFTCKVSARRTAQLPEPLPPWSFELNGTALPPAPGRTVVMGKGAYADLPIAGPDIAALHAILVAADGKWQVCDLASESGTILNGKTIRHADLSDGDLLKIGLNQIRVGCVTALADALAHSHVTIVSSGESFLGGMPVVLPEVAPPKGFGRVGISFGGKSLTGKMSMPTESAPPKRDEFVAVNTTEVAVVDAPPAEEPTDLPVLTPPPRPFPTVPKLKRPDPVLPANIEEEPLVEDDQLVVNDAAFGGTNLGAARGAFDVDAFGEQEMSLSAMDLTPTIPPSTPGGGSTAGDSGDGNGEKIAAVRTAVAPVPRPALVGAKPSTGPAPVVAPRRWLSRSRKATILKTLMAACMLGAAGGIWVGLPTHSTLQGRLSYLNTAAPDSAAAQEFQADQLRRLADPGLRQIALQNLQNDHPGATPGFLADDGSGIASVVSSARFDGPNLVLQYRGLDEVGDSRRLAAVLKAMYQSDADLVAAVTDATKAMADWDPRVASRKEEMDTLERRMAQLQKRIDAAKGITEKVAGLQADAMKAGDQYMAAEQPVEADLAKLDELNARLAAGVSTTATTRPATQPSQSDMELAELQRQIDDISEQISSLKGTVAGDSVGKSQKEKADSQKDVDVAKATAATVLSDHPDVRVSLESATQLQSRIDGLIDQLIQFRSDEAKLLAMQDMIEQTRRRRQQIIEDSDARLQQLRAQLDAAQLQAVHAEAAVDSAATQPTTRPAIAEAASEARRNVNELQYAYQIREQQLQADDSARLRSRIGQLISDGNEQRMARRQLATDTLATLQSGLDATLVPVDLSPEERAELTKVMQAVRDLMQKQSAYADAVAQSDPVELSLASLTQQLAELKARADARRRVLAATGMKDDSEKAAVLADRAATAERLERDRAAMETARGDFAARMLASADAGLAVFDAQRAQDALAALTETHDMKMEDMKAMQRSRDDLAERLKTTVDVKRPSDSDVVVIADDDARKVIYMLLAMAAVGAGFVPLIRGTHKRGGAAAG